MGRLVQAAFFILFPTAARARLIASDFHFQIRNKTELTFEEYREQEGWKLARLDYCPLHPEGGCGISRHGTYMRKFPEPSLIARYYCSVACVSISLLPDFFASRLPGTLDEVEEAVNVAEDSSSLEEAAEVVRPDILYPYNLRWLLRRIRYVREALVIIAGLFPDLVYPDLKSFRQWLGCEKVLCALREKAAAYLHSIPMIVGLIPP